MGAVKISTRLFDKVCNSTAFADVKGNDGGNANAQKEHSGAATLENWIHILTVKFPYFQLTFFDPVHTHTHTSLSERSA